jgi:hypothetical protein
MLLKGYYLTCVTSGALISTNNIRDQLIFYIKLPIIHILN